MKNEKFIYFLSLIFLVLIIFASPTFAESDYVLPYPSSMPGGLSYKFHLIYESISKYWYFGDFGQFNYNLKMADKYLVEAKILFDYKQYLLAVKSLQRSDYYFINILPSIARAESKGKNINQKKIILKEAAEKHIEVLENVEKNIPETFIWRPEKSQPTILYLKKTILDAISVRGNVL